MVLLILLLVVVIVLGFGCFAIELIVRWPSCLVFLSAGRLTEEPAQLLLQEPTVDFHLSVIDRPCLLVGDFQLG